jgi:hypothetical protein
MANKKGEPTPGAPGEIVSIEQLREKTIELLSYHFAQDNLSLEELESRMERVYRASSVPALREFVNDLPSEADAAPSAQAVSAPLPAAFAPQRDRIVSIMSETKRSGLAQVSPRLDLLLVMSDTKLDLSGAQLTAPVTEIHVRAVMASAHITVPRGVRVVVQAGAFMGSVTDDTQDEPVPPGAPVVRITGRVVMAELKVATGTGSYRLPRTS